MTKKGIVLVLLMLTVGFASLTTSLYINGTIRVRSSAEDFEKNVIFSSASAEKGTATISTDGKTLTYTTDALKTINETSTLSYTITNNSQYGAQFSTPSVVCTPTNSTDALMEEYLALTIGTELDGINISPTSSANGTLQVSLKKSHVGDDTQISYKCTISATATEARRSS